MINWIAEYETIPNSLLELDIKTIFKGKGSITDIANYRGIFLGNKIIMLLEKLINARTSPKIESSLTESQAGGRKNRNITDHLFIIRSVIQYYKYMNKSLLIEFLDLRQAFDKMILKNIMTDLWKCNVRGKMWRLIYLINKQATISIRTNFGKTPPIQIGETLKQGSVLASSLAAMHTDSVNKLFEHQGLGIYYGAVPLGNLIFQDDIARFEDNQANLNQANKQFNAFKNKNRMEFHPTKSNFMVNKKLHPKISLGTVSLNPCTEYKYLGDILTSDDKMNATINQRKNSLTGLTAELNAILEQLDQSHLHIDAILQYHKGIVLPRLLINSETWDLTKTNLASLETIQNTNLKRLLRLPPSTPTIGLRNELNLLSLENQIIQKRMLYFHRILNLPETNITQQVLLQQQKIPGNTWLSATTTQLENLGINIGLDELRNIKKQTWKMTIKNAVLKKETEERKTWLETSTKCKNLERTENDLPPYLKKLNPLYALTILKTRLGMLDLKTNYKTAHTDLTCPLCNLEPDTLPHLFTCQKLSQTFNPPIDFGKNIYKNSDTAPQMEFLETMAQAISKISQVKSDMLEEKEERRAPALVPSERRNVTA